MYDEMIIDHVDLKYDCKILKSGNEKVSVEIKLVKNFIAQRSLFTTLFIK